MYTQTWTKWTNGQQAKLPFLVMPPSSNPCLCNWASCSQEHCLCHQLGLDSRGPTWTLLGWGIVSGFARFYPRPDTQIYWYAGGVICKGCKQKHTITYTKVHVPSPVQAHNVGLMWLAEARLVTQLHLLYHHTVTAVPRRANQGWLNCYSFTQHSSSNTNIYTVYTYMYIHTEASSHWVHKNQRIIEMHVRYKKTFEQNHLWRTHLWHHLTKMVDILDAL